MNYSERFASWAIENDTRWSITSIETYGDTVEELIENCSVFIESWNGAFTKCRKLSGLPMRDCMSIEEILTNWAKDNAEAV